MVLVKPPGELFLEPLMSQCPGLQHSSGAENTWDRMLFAELRQRVMKGLPDPVIVNEIKFRHVFQQPVERVVRKRHTAVDGLSTLICAPDTDIVAQKCLC